MCIYAIRHPDGYMKIGSSKHPYKRLSTLQMGTPYKLELFTVLTVDGDSEKLEKLLHKCLSDYHVRGEWFDIPRSHIKGVFNAEVKHEDSPAQWHRTPGYSGVA